jgi:tripartite-type tricarboxylate transporter receptor subunit TctC
VLARRLAERLSPAFGQTVLVENRPGAGGTTGADYVAKSPPDGTTLLMGVTGSNAIAQSLYPSLPYDTVRSFSPVSRVVSAPLVLVVTNAMPVTDMAGYIAAAKAAPNTITHATPGNGTSMHLTGEMFGQQAGVQLVHVPYRGSAQATTDLIAGQVLSSFADILVILPQIRAGAVRPLAVSSLTRHPLLPEVPTMAESGLAGLRGLLLAGALRAGRASRADHGPALCRGRARHAGAGDQGQLRPAGLSGRSHDTHGFRDLRRVGDRALGRRGARGQRDPRLIGRSFAPPKPTPPKPRGIWKPPT